jgi:AhpD family alkylhydroperoxidase
MNPRIDYFRMNTRPVQPLLQVEAYLSKCGLEHRLLHLVKMRASQINGCAYCLDMHSKDARADEETEQRLYCLEAWRETPFYSERERAALDWTEAVTLVTDDHVSDAAYDAVRAQFSEAEIIDLTLAVAMINSWNRLNIALRAGPGAYRVGMHTTPSHDRSSAA